ncbi:MAG: glutathione S-transferase [Gammaproteobacteria bacterium]|nr:glutathione S-transferase [Gammaproteobacteria bacterium]
MSHPILYSFRRCPYCMRAHMALKQTGIKIELREVKLSDMPEEALSISPEATVPILALPDGTVITESWDIVKWSLAQNDADKWLGNNDEHSLDAEVLIETNDFSFKEDLDHYKYADRFPDHSEEHYRKACEAFIEELEEMLIDNNFLLAGQLSLADIGVFPFIRQFSLVNKEWFDNAPYPKVQKWLDNIISTELFQHVFQKHELWQADDIAIYI